MKKLKTYSSSHPPFQLSGMQSSVSKSQAIILCFEVGTSAHQHAGKKQQRMAGEGPFCLNGYYSLLMFAVHWAQVLTEVSWVQSGPTSDVLGRLHQHCPSGHCFFFLLSLVLHLISFKFLVSSLKKKAIPN